MTMVEMSAAMLILGIVSSSLGVLVYGSTRMANRNELRLDQINSARVSIEAMARTLRTAVLPSQLGAACGATQAATDPACAKAAFVSGTASSVQFYGNINNENNMIGPSRVTYTLNNGSLIETIQAPDTHAINDFNYTYCTPSATCVPRTRTLAMNVQSTRPLFTYYNAAGAAMAATTLTAADLGAVDSIEILVAVQKAASTQPATTTFVQRVALPNADSVIRTNGS